MRAPCVPPSGTSVSAKRQPAQRGWHEFFALDHVQHLEHARIQHLPRTQLLLDHVETRLFEIH
jgi:hypothetical protein